MFFFSLCIKDSSNIFPLDQYKIIGSIVNIQCFSTVRANWTFKNGPLPHGFSTSLSLNAIDGKASRIQFGGKYQCKGKNNKGEQFLAESWLKIGSKLIL